MADSNIGALPLAPSVADDSLLVMEQQGAAMKLTGQMLKSYAKQGVELEFQDALDEAKQAAESAAGAVSAVTDMTVEAHTSGTPTVTKSMRAGKVNLDFGLPRGEQGEPGPPGETGPRGPQGAPGTGLDILGHYDTEDALRAAVTAPAVGDAYGVGLEPPYDIYVLDGVTNDWKNYGPLSGGGSSILPENVVTTEGGAALEIPAGFGGAPHTIFFTEEAEPPLTADDIEYGAGSVQDALDGLFTSVSDGKALIASAVTDKGVSTAPDASFAQMAENIGQIQAGGGGDTSDATATPGDILSPKTAYTASGKVEGIIPSLPAQTITPGTEDKTIANGQYLSGTQTIKGDANLIPANIREGVSIFGIPGALNSEFKATLTVTADIGAVVTATHTTGAEVSALSTTGAVTLELPIEGTWTVTAVRGVAQYNTVAIEVSSSYSASLTAEVHVVYFGAAAVMSEDKFDMKAAKVGKYALFAGGMHCSYNITSYTQYAVDNTPTEVYDENLTHSTTTTVAHCTSSAGTHAFNNGASASIENYALFAGGTYGDRYSNGASDVVAAFDAKLTKTEPTPLSEARSMLAGAVVGEYALFGGGSNVVDAYNGSLTRTTPTVLGLASRQLFTASCGGHAIFAGGSNNVTTAYDQYLTRTIAPALSDTNVVVGAAAAGNYALFVGKNEAEAYDLFLTKTKTIPLQTVRSGVAATNNEYFAIFAGGQNAEGESKKSSAAVDVYDAFLTKTVAADLPRDRNGIAAATIGNYALFAGGYFRYSDGITGPSTDRTDAYQYV